MIVKIILLFLVFYPSTAQWNTLCPNSPSRVETGPDAQIPSSVGSSMWCMNSDDIYVLTNDNQMWKFEKEDKRWLWQPTPNLSGPRFGSAYWKIQGKFYIYGGQHSNGDQVALDDMWSYDLVNRVFIQESVQTNNPGPCYGMSFWTHEPSNRLFFWGGMCQNKTNSNVYAFDINLKHWSVISSNGPKGSLYGAALLSTSDNKVYLYTQDQLWSFDMTTMLWQNIRSAIMPTGPNRTHMILWNSIDGENLMLYGGQSGSKLFGDTWYYNFNTQSWRVKATDGPVPREGMAACVDSNGYLNLFGGNDGLYILNDLWQYGPFTVKNVVDMVQWKLDSATIMATWAATTSTIMLVLFTVVLLGFCARKCIARKRAASYPIGNLNSKPIFVHHDGEDIMEDDI